MPVARGLTCDRLQPVLAALLAAGNAVELDHPDRDGPIVSLRRPIDPAVVAAVAGPGVLLRADRLTCDHCHERVVGADDVARGLAAHRREVRRQRVARLTGWLRPAPRRR